MSAVSVLLVEDDREDARFVAEALAGDGSTLFEVTHASRLGAALQQLSARTFDVALLDLSLPDSRGLETFERVRAQAADLPVVILTGLDDERTALLAVHDEAQDCLVKGQIGARLLARSIRHAIERQSLKAAARQLSLLDELTGLYNRRGFLALAEHRLRLARRSDQESLLLFADLDGLKRINDTLGHEEGDRALVEAAQVLRSCFRESDVVARLGGDEFVVLAGDAAPAAAEVIRRRLDETVRRRNEGEPRRYELSLSVGIVPVPAGEPRPVEGLLAEADRAMYLRKRARYAALGRQGDAAA